MLEVVLWMLARCCNAERGAGKLRGAGDLRFPQTIVERTRWSPFFFLFFESEGKFRTLVGAIVDPTEAT